MWATKTRYSSVGVCLRKCVGTQGRREGKGLVGRGESERILVFSSS